MKQPELTLSFEIGDVLWDGTSWVRVEGVDYEKQEVTLNTLEKVYNIAMHRALRWYAQRNGECIRNPWSKP